MKGMRCLPGTGNRQQVALGVHVAPLLLFMPSGGEIFIILFAMLLLFGGKKIPELLRGLGKGIREFNEARENLKDSVEAGIRQQEREKGTPA